MIEKKGKIRGKEKTYSQPTHLIERGRDETGQADDIGFFLHGSFEDLLAGAHHAQIDDSVVVASQNDADDVLADVVDVALDGGHDHGTGEAICLVFHFT